MARNNPEMFDRMVNNMKVEQRDKTTREDINDMDEIARMDEEINKMPEDLGGFMPRRETL